MKNPDQKKGVSALNKDFRKYDQVNKDQEYRLSENRELDEFDNEYTIETCDLEKFFTGGEEGKREFAEELGRALEGIGFAILTGHGIEPELYRDAEAAVGELFATTTVEERLKYEASRFGSVNQGYFPIKETTIIHPDLVEGWVFCRRAFDMDDVPDYDPGEFWLLPEQEPLFRRLAWANEELILPVMQSILRYLGCDPNSFDSKLSRTNFGMRLNYYPPIDNSMEEKAGRMLGHEDVDLFTFLPAQNVEGLQVYNRENGKWIRLNAPPGSIVLNTGDYMQRISNDRLPSTTHRVARPFDKTLNDVPRISIPMAVYLWEEEILEVLPGLGDPRYEPVSAIEFHTKTTSKYYGDSYAVEK